MDFVHQLYQVALGFLESLGVWGLIVGLAVEVIPSEIVLGFGGYLVYIGEVSFLTAVIFGTIGAVIQQWILYGLGYVLGRPFFEKYGKYLRIKPAHLDRAEQWFKRYGSGVVFTARFVPVMRQVISIPAGISRMNFWLYTALTTVASIPWAILFVYIGRQFGPFFSDPSVWLDKIENDPQVSMYVKYAFLAAIIVLILYVIVKKISHTGATQEGDNN